MMNKVIITIAPTGNVPTKEKNPNTPVTAQDIADQIYACWREGAAVAHIHARDSEGKPTTDRDAYRAILDKLATYKDCDVITQLSTGARGGAGFVARGAMLSLQPEMASLSTGSSNFPTRGNFNDPETIAHLAGEMAKYKVKPEIEVFDAAMVSNAVDLHRKGVIPGPLQFNLVMGVPGSIPATFKNLFFLYESLPPGCPWTITAVGPLHVELSAMALALGGNVRAGLEDNIYYSKGVLADNLSLLRRVKGLILAMGKEVATSSEARTMLGLA